MSLKSEHGKMHWLGWVVVALALIEAGWLAFDGARALVVGDSLLSVIQIVLLLLPAVQAPL